MLALVVKSKSYYGNVLGYDTKTKEYVYLKFGKEQWRVPAINGELFNYCNTKRKNDEFMDESEMMKLEEYSIYDKYSQSCQEGIKLKV